jgi:folate-binding protein YgfZ
MLTALPAPQLIELSGADAVAFAQAQFSADVSALANGHWQWSAWLSAQGRVRAFFQLLRDDDTHLRLLLRGGSAPRLRDALARYVLRAKVQLRVVDGIAACASEHAADVGAVETPPLGTHFRHHAHVTCMAMPGATPRWLCLREADATPIAADDSADARNRWALADIDAGIVTLDAALEEQLLPDWIGLRDLGATCVGKGCYPGQEIVARLHFKGGNKRWLHRIEFAATTLPAPGTRIVSGHDSEVGTLVCSAWIEPGRGAALAVLGDAPPDEMRFATSGSPAISGTYRAFAMPPSA